MPSEMGLSWLAVETTASAPPSRTSQAQPEPNWLTPASLSLPWKSANEPKASSIAAREIAARRAAAVGAHALPEERVVEVAAAVVADGRPLVVGDAVEAGQDLLDRPVGPVGPLERGVDLVHVGLVVLVVVDPHRLLVDVRLERAVVVGERWDGVRHVRSLLGRLDATETSGRKGHLCSARAT